MASNDDHDYTRNFVLSLLEYGPQGMEEIKKAILRSMSDYAGEAEATTVAGRSRFDVIMWGIMSSLCNAGLVESTGVQRFHITNKGKEVHRKHNPMISIEILKKESEEYCGLVTRVDNESALSPKKILPVSMNGIVALIDMLGTRELHKVNHTMHMRMHNNWHALLSYANHLVEEESKLQDCKVSAFSDTMFVTAKGNAEVLLSAFGGICTRLIPKSICLDIPIRGCVAAGKFYQSGDALISGPAVSEAAAYYELPQWIGISSCPSAYNKIDGLSSGRGYYTKYDIPLKNSVEYGGLVVNWPDRYNHEHEDKEKELNDMLGRLERRMGRTSDISASLKWRNTRDFLCMATGVEGRPVGSSR